MFFLFSLPSLVSLFASLLTGFVDLPPQRWESLLCCSLCPVLVWGLGSSAGTGLVPGRIHFLPVLFSDRRNSLCGSPRNSPPRLVCWDDKVTPVLPRLPSPGAPCPQDRIRILIQGQVPPVPLSALILKRCPVRASQPSRLTCFRQPGTRVCTPLEAPLWNAFPHGCC